MRLFYSRKENYFDSLVKSTIKNSKVFVKTQVFYQSKTIHVPKIIENDQREENLRSILKTKNSPRNHGRRITFAKDEKEEKQLLLQSSPVKCVVSKI